MFDHPKLYTRDASGHIRYWFIQQDGERYRSHSGRVDGDRPVTTGWTTAEPTNIGRSNELNAVEQACAEIAAEYQKKLDRKYYKTQVEAGCATFGGHKFFAPMLAQKYKEGPVTQAVFSQPKLDGFRCIATAAQLTSRQGKPFIVPHVQEALQPIFDKYPDVILDGELYNHEYHDNFNEIASLIKNPNRDQALVQYHIYDVPSHDAEFSSRRDMLSEIRSMLRGTTIRVVPTHRVMHTETLDSLYELYLKVGYEGQIVRLDTPYEIGKRSHGLLKRKNFVDAEFPISRIYEGTGNWAGYAKGVEIIAPNDARAENGERPCAGIRGNQDFCRRLLTEDHGYKFVTVRFLGFTPGGVPRCPVAIQWHTAEEKE